MATGLRKKIKSIFETRHGYVTFKGSKDNFIENGGEILERSISLFHDRTNPVRCFSVDELNSMNLEKHRRLLYDGYSEGYGCVWEGRLLLIKVTDFDKWAICQDLVLHTRMMSHPNVHKLIGCCLDTEAPVLVYEWGQYESLSDLVLMTNRQNREPLEWKIRLEIAWQIAYALAYLHTAFHRPIVYRNLDLEVVFLDQDNTVKLKDFYFAIQIPEGEEFAESCITGTRSFLAPEYLMTGRITEKVDVYDFGVIFLVLLTGKKVSFALTVEQERKRVNLIEWVRDQFQDEDIWDIIDRSMLTNKVLLNKHIQEHFLMAFRASIELALRCTEEEEYSRPSIVEAAAELKNIIRSQTSS